MPVNHFIQLLNSYLPLSEAYQDFTRHHVQTIHAKAKEILLPLNHHKLVFIFVFKGMIFSWRNDGAGNVVPRNFTHEGQLTGTTIHPLYPVVIPDGISCLEDSIVVMGEIAIAKPAIELFDEARELINILVHQNQYHQQELQEALLIHDAEHRFKKMQSLAPELFKRVPERLLAPYLNMSRVHFNRLKNRVYKGPR
ncbi:cAMP-binding domain of CRP or a regulatory subunit of cAMP-dependent protein kinases [Mucilaginibacter lappiensis]|uniref:cAMP-binding domain of CRP or a regulatory subunit of cAMP-dependent protein kinases n=1 Tax=Mucilaginibacter lappiensis TaxID=354630 RepID=A0ABR6PKF2_9SPHI|nr:hypothetical protein [Mucilaginibacter lappiensis]MBB6108721.1 hypothetical protein [Mucilaginibacter lappiensis]SIQ26579.1 cAMP-binding domain of CRP or a regulatory subunit of cAMP-dependent protein kinases [Mucilaginibacter lappiensis]